MRSFPSLVLLAVLATACGGAKEKPSDIGVAAVPAATQLPPIDVEVKAIAGTITLPGAWQNAFAITDRADTTLGGSHVVEFNYPGDSAGKIPPRLLLAVRSISKANWAKLEAKKVQVATKLAERGDTVFVYSIVGQNPYPMNTTAGIRVEGMMLALVAADSPLKLTLK